MDVEGRQLPGRQILRDVCTHTYRRWNSVLATFD
jgi:phage-related protein